MTKNIKTFTFASKVLESIIFVEGRKKSKTGQVKTGTSED